MGKPPLQQDPFSVIFYSLQNLKIFGEVETAFFNDYDYKIDAKFEANKFIVNLAITRNELDLKEVKAKYAYLFKNSKATPFCCSFVSIHTNTLSV